MGKRAAAGDLPGTYSKELGYIDLVSGQARINHPSIHFHPCIPDKKLKNALNSYASGCKKPETPLVLLDDSAFGNAKSGCLITDRRVYCHTLAGTRQVALSELGQLRFRGAVMSQTIFTARGKLLEVTGPGRETVRLLTHMLQEMTLSIHGKKEGLL